MGLILKREENFIIARKPHGMPSQQDPSGDLDLLCAVREECKEAKHPTEVYPVHRLDRPVGGLCVIATNKKSAAALSALVSDHEDFEKIYLAICEGVPENGEYVDYLLQNSKIGKSAVVKKETRDAKEAKLIAEVLSTATVGRDTFSLVAVKLKTGRFHQIRAQLSSRTYPIFGDTKYGSRKKTQGIALFASALRFTYDNETYSAKALPDTSMIPWSYFSAEDYKKLDTCRFES